MKFEKYIECPYECRYYGSELNKFIDKETDRKKTVNNIDCIIYKGNYYGVDRIRIIESKHSKEKGKQSQFKLLNVLSNILKIINSSEENICCELYVVTGDYPYDYIEIKDLLENENYIINNQDDFISWLNFEKNIKEFGIPEKVLFSEMV